MVEPTHLKKYAQVKLDHLFWMMRGLEGCLGDTELYSKKIPVRVCSSIAGIPLTVTINKDIPYRVHRKYIFQKTSSVIIDVKLSLCTSCVILPRKNPHDLDILRFLGEFRYYKYPPQKKKKKLELLFTRSDLTQPWQTNLGIRNPALWLGSRKPR